jgi:magnesium-transporting ATPase (P-type)
MTEEGGETTATTSRVQLFPFHASSSEECFKHLSVSNVETHSRTGLTTVEATERLERYGYNKLTEKRKKTIWERIWTQVANVLVLILVIVAAVAAAQAIQFASTKPRDNEGIVTNCIEVALIAFVIMYVSCGSPLFTA